MLCRRQPTLPSQGRRIAGRRWSHRVHAKGKTDVKPGELHSQTFAARAERVLGPQDRSRLSDHNSCSQGQPNSQPQPQESSTSQQPAAAGPQGWLHQQTLGRWQQLGSGNQLIAAVSMAFCICNMDKARSTPAASMHCVQPPGVPVLAACRSTSAWPSCPWRTTMAGAARCQA